MTAVGVVAAGRSLPLFSSFVPQPWSFAPDKDIVPAPSDPAQWRRFREQLADWRRQTRQALGYDDGLYRRQEFATWVHRCFACGFLMVSDERFMDAGAGRFTPDRMLDEADWEFGGFDAVVLWHAYPRIGFDSRNQYDFYRDLPGGFAGLRELSRHLNRRGVRVFVDWNPWDNDTRPEGKSHIEALADLCGAIEADGIFLDTLPRGSDEFRPRLDQVRPGVVLESEIALPVEGIATHHMSWAQWFQDSAAPGVLRNKWFERRHIQHQIKRWDTDHTGELHAAWMNGSGMMIWENVFGTWNGWSPRDRSILRSMLPIQHRFAELFAGEGWTPLVPTEQPETYASLWEGDGLRLWTLVNRRQRIVEGELLRVEHEPDEQLFDLIAGDRVSRLAGRLEPRGIGCFLAGRRAGLGESFDRFLSTQRSLQGRADFTIVRSPLAVGVQNTARSHPLRTTLPSMVEIPGRTFVLRTEFRRRECGCYRNDESAAISTGLHRPALFEREVTVARFAIDRIPVTNAEFRRFLEVTTWRPRHRENFLKLWPDWQSLVLPPGKDNHPVVYVDLDDARAYAEWMGKRLPSEEEWQYAAGGPEAFKWPWGNEWRDGLSNAGTDERDPTTGESLGRNGDTMPVDHFPRGASAFGVLDLTGNVWEWTDSERTDGRTRFALVKGGSYYNRARSDWYADGGPKPNDFVAKVLLSWPGVDRCATIGFRCAATLV